MANGTQPGNGNSNPFTSGGKANPFNPAGQTNPQTPAKHDIDMASMPAGGLIIHADPKPGAPSSHDVGVGSMGNSGKPFRLNGGG